MTSWKRLLVISAGFGAGFAICAAAIVAAVYWYSTRPKPWNNTAIRATFETIEFRYHPQQSTYSADFLYKLENTTASNYEFNPSNITIFANLADEFSNAPQKDPALSKDFGDYQHDVPVVDGPPFIPPHNTARFHVRVVYEFPNGLTEAQKADLNQVVGPRLKELKSIALFDQSDHYRIDLPKGWEGVEDQTELKKR
jgi:hypothetical protein